MAASFITEIRRSNTVLSKEDDLLLKLEEARLQAEAREQDIKAKDEEILELKTQWADKQIQ